MTEQALDDLIRDSVAAAAAPSMQRAPETGRVVPREKLAQPTAPPRWALKRLVAWIETRFARRVSRETLRQVLKRLEFSWKEAKALLNRATTAAREAFVAQLQTLLRRTLAQL